jgi:hypothetical protein
MRSPINLKQGFTRLDLIVVAALIGLLIALFFPAVFRTRTDVWRIWCSNNLRQVCLATLNYHDTYGVFPQGTRASRNLSPEERLSWFVSILPFLEQDNLWCSAAKDDAWDAESNSRLRTTELRVLICEAAPTAAFTSGLGMTTYIGVAGVGIDAETLPLEDKHAGFFGYDRQVRAQDIKDGLSNTMMVMETTRALGPWVAGGPKTVRGLDPENQPYLALDGQFGLKHRKDSLLRRGPIGSNIAIADGSVRFLTDSISRETLEALATIAGGDTPGDDY